MNYQQHISQAEHLLKHAEEAAAVAHSTDEVLLVITSLLAAQAHAQIAEAKRWVTT